MENLQVPRCYILQVYGPHALTVILSIPQVKCKVMKSLPGVLYFACPIGDKIMANETGSPQVVKSGYEIELCVYDDGTFGVTGPLPLTESESDEEPESFTSIRDALLALVRIVKENPVGVEGQKSFEAGYASGPKEAGGMPESGAGY